VRAASGPLPNKRLKLTGGERLKGIGGLIASLLLLTFHVGCAGVGAPAA